VVFLRTSDYFFALAFNKLNCSHYTNILDGLHAILI